MYMNDNFLIQMRNQPVAQTKLKQIKQRLEHGVPPLTNQECRWLYFLVTGDEIPTRKRCRKCDGHGKWGHGSACSACDGEGYVNVA